MQYIAWFEEVGIDDVASVGGKNASLGEMFQTLREVGIRVPNGFATTADAYRLFLEVNGLEARIATELDGWDRSDVSDLETRAHNVRAMILQGQLPDGLVAAVVSAYDTLCTEAGIADVACAVRSSATAEDLPRHRSLDNKRPISWCAGPGQWSSRYGGATQASIPPVPSTIARTWASVSKTSRCPHVFNAWSAPTRPVAASSLRSIPTLATRASCISTAAWGLGENIVQGRVIPDSFLVHKAALKAGHRPIVSSEVGAKELTMAYDSASGRITNDRTPDATRQQLCINADEVLQLSKWACSIEDHYTAKRGIATPMDIEWAKDGLTGELFIVQARPRNRVLPTTDRRHGGVSPIRRR